jgi:hypothetical protein
VLNFLEFGGWQGWLPVRLTPKTTRAESIMGDTNLFAHNLHKPCPAQHAAFLTKLNGGEPALNKGFQNWNYLVLNMIAWNEGEPFVEEF